MAELPSPTRLRTSASIPEGSGGDAALRNPGSGASRARRTHPAPPRRARQAEALGIDVARQLEGLITDGTLRPGERLNEVALSRSLGVSRGPVREAARALEKHGLVTVIMNRGAFVRSLALEEAREIYEINAVLFGLAAGGAAKVIDAARAASLRGMVEAMEAAIGQDDRDGFFGINSGFHAFIMECGGNREAQALYGQLTRKLMLLRRRSFERAGHMLEANGEHRALMGAILAGDAGRARELAEAHARFGCARFLEAIGHTAERHAAGTEGRDAP